MHVLQGEYVQPNVNQQDLDRDFRLSPASLLKWMQAARMSLSWVGAGPSA
jgi:hypothetical protein